MQLFHWFAQLIGIMRHIYCGWKRKTCSFSPVRPGTGDPLRCDFANQQTVAWTANILLPDRGVLYWLPRKRRKRWEGWYQQFHLFCLTTDSRGSNQGQGNDKDIIHRAALDSRWPRCICRTWPHAGASCPPQICRSDRPDSWWLERCCCPGCPAASMAEEARLAPPRWGMMPDLKADKHLKKRAKRDA